MRRIECQLTPRRLDHMIFSTTKTADRRFYLLTQQNDRRSFRSLTFPFPIFTAQWRYPPSDPFSFSSSLALQYSTHMPRRGNNTSYLQPTHLTPATIAPVLSSAMETATRPRRRYPLRPAGATRPARIQASKQKARQSAAVSLEASEFRKNVLTLWRSWGHALEGNIAFRIWTVFPVSRRILWRRCRQTPRNCLTAVRRSRISCAIWPLAANPAIHLEGEV